MSDPAGFRFLDDVSEFKDDDALVARVDAGVGTKQRLLRLLAEQLAFPGYFGFNWDALYDCLSELPGPVVILHEDLPLRTAAERRIYLGVLRDAADLTAVFPAACRRQITRLLSPANQ
jgi:RNAse (barnase) inhibitor barstar